MTPQERDLINAFLQQLNQARAGNKDAEADALIRDAVVRQPDAAYLLVQRAMGLEFALQAAQANLAKLQAELDQQRRGSGGSFLDAGNAWGRAAAAPAPSAYAPSAPAVARPSAQPAPPAAPAGAWGSGMLGTVASTAAGVVAGSFLFQGIQGLMGHHEHSVNAAADDPRKQGGFEPLSADAQEEPGPPHDSPDDADLASDEFESGESA